MHGFYNKYLYINLKDKTYREKKLSDEVLAANLGGKGLATHLLLENLAPGTRPFVTGTNRRVRSEVSGNP